MSSSTFTFVDQNGNPVWGLATRISRNDGDTSKAEDERYPDKAGHTTFLEVKKVLPADNGHTLHWNFNEGLNPDWQHYEHGSRHYTDIESADDIRVPIVIKREGSADTCPSTHDKAAVQDWFFKVAGAVGAHTNTPQNREAMKAGFTKCGVKWQNQDRGDTRARFFLEASGPNGDSDFPVDTGDEFGPFKLTFRY